MSSNRIERKEMAVMMMSMMCMCMHIHGSFVVP